MKPLPTYRRVLDTVDPKIGLCKGCDVRSDAAGHWRGVWDVDVVHWSRSRPTRAGIRDFLWGAFYLSDDWRDIASTAKSVLYHASYELHIELGDQMGTHKARVRFLLRDPEKRKTDEAKRAWEWARY